MKLFFKKKTSNKFFDEEKTKRRFKTKKNLIIFSLSLIVIILAIVSCIIINNYYKELNKITFEDYNLYQYFSGIKFSYNGTISLKKDGDITKIDYNNIDIDTDNTPIYFETIDNEVLFPENMSIIFLRIKNKTYK